MKSALMACALLAALAGCASTGDGRIEALTQARADAVLVPGATTRDDVRRAFGDALVTAFPDGREVWFYQYDDSAARLVKYVPLVGRMAATGAQVKELKILFGADGRVRKFKLQDIHRQ